MDKSHIGCVIWGYHLGYTLSHLDEQGQKLLVPPHPLHIAPSHIGPYMQ